MPTESPGQTIERSLQSAERPLSPSPRVDAAVIGWCFVWPVVFFVCLPFVAPGDTLQACLLGAGSFLWFISCFGVFGILLRMIQRWRPHPVYRRLVVGWFLGWLPLITACGRMVPLADHFNWIYLSFIGFGTVLWLASCYGIYDMLFAMAETRWPVAKPIREMMSSLVRAFVSYFHHHPR